MNTKYIIAPYVQTGFLNKTLLFGFGSKRKMIEDENLHKGILEASIFMQVPRSLPELRNYLGSKDLEDDVIDRIIEILNDGFLFPEGSFDLSDPSIGNLLYYCFSGADVEKVRREISEKSVVMFGCHGIAAMVAYALASFGVRKLILVDPTIVDASFKFRQMNISPEDEGKSSSDSLKEYLKRCFKHVQVDSKRSASLSASLEEIQEVDFLVHTSIQPGSLSMVNRFSLKRKIPFIDLGIVEDIAVCGPLYIPGKTGCAECWSAFSASSEQSQIREMCRAINKNYRAPNNVGVNMLTASLVSLDIIKFLGGFGEVRSINNKVGLWTHNGVFEKQSQKINPECSLCSSLS